MFAIKVMVICLGTRVGVVVLVLILVGVPHMFTAVAHGHVTTTYIGRERTDSLHKIVAYAHTAIQTTPQRNKGNKGNGDGLSGA